MAPLTATAPTKPPGGAFWTGIVFMVSAVLVALGAIATAATLIGSSEASATRLDLPGSATVELDDGRHSLWSPRQNNLSGYAITIEGTGGEVEYRRFGFFGSLETIGRDGVTYSPDGFFEVATPGRYTVTAVELDGSTEPKSLLIGPGDQYAPNTILAAAGAVLLSALVFLIGLTLWIIGLVRRSRARRSVIGPSASAPPGYLPPGYAPPGGTQPGYAPPGEVAPVPPPAGVPVPGGAITPSSPAPWPTPPTGPPPEPGPPPPGAGWPSS